MFFQLRHLVPRCRLGRRKVHSTQFNSCLDLIRGKVTRQVVDEVFLTILAKDHAVQDQRPAKIGLLDQLSTVWQGRYMTFDLGFSIWGDPKGKKIVLTIAST